MANEVGSAQLANLRCVAAANCSLEKYCPGAIDHAQVLTLHVHPLTTTTTGGKTTNNNNNNNNNNMFLTSDQARLPAEFKHITKRRKRN